MGKHDLAVLLGTSLLEVLAVRRVRVATNREFLIRRVVRLVVKSVSLDEKFLNLISSHLALPTRWLPCDR
jgi:hypothetical protein